jgi:hypothetical protein
VVNHTFDASTDGEQQAIANLRLALQLNLAAVLHKVRVTVVVETSHRAQQPTDRLLS